MNIIEKYTEKTYICENKYEWSILICNDFIGSSKKWVCVDILDLLITSYNRKIQQLGTDCTIENLYHRQSYSDMAITLSGRYHQETIKAGIDRLLQVGLIEIHKNPDKRYKFDKTNFYLLKVDVINKWLETYYGTDGNENETQ